MKIYNAIGIMSGTSMDGIDAALVEIHRDELGKSTIKYIDFYFESYPENVRARLLELADRAQTTTQEITLAHHLIGRLYTETVKKLMAKHTDIKLDLIGTHGQTLYHSLEEETYLGHLSQGSLQLGEPSYLAEEFNCPVISDFRVRDIAANGLGAPLVPFVEYDLYATDEDVVFLNVGGISNISFIGPDPSETVGFDSGPGNMLIDQAMVDISNNELTYDADGAFAAAGTTSPELLNHALENPYYKQTPPKNSGRENFGQETYDNLKKKAEELGLSQEDFVRSLTTLTARANADAIREFCPRMPVKLIVSGGGSKNKTLLAELESALPDVEVLLGDILEYPNDAKEAIAFAYLGYKTLMREPNTLHQTTGAKHDVIMGKISY